MYDRVHAWNTAKLLTLAYYRCIFVLKFFYYLQLYLKIRWCYCIITNTISGNCSSLTSLFCAFYMHQSCLKVEKFGNKEFRTKLFSPLVTLGTYEKRWTPHYHHQTSRIRRNNNCETDRRSQVLHTNKQGQWMRKMDSFWREKILHRYRIHKQHVH